MGRFNLKIENPGTRELRKFSLVTGTIVAGLFGLFLPWIFDYPWPLWPWVVTGIFYFWGLVHPDSIFIVYSSWLKFGHILGLINTRIILGILFYVVFFPAGILMRLMRKDPMSRKLDETTKSYRIISESLDKNHIERPY